MKRQFELSQLKWTLTGWIPFLWHWDKAAAPSKLCSDAQVTLDAQVPGSVQHALRMAGLLPDWNVGLNAQSCEWVENRQWLYETAIPDSWLEEGKQIRLICLGLDYSGSLLFNDRFVSTFSGTHVPHRFDLTGQLDKQNVLQIMFDPPPRWLGQFGYTSKMTEWKVRFNYGWDWVPRLVQIGIWDSIRLEVTDGQEIEDITCVADADVSTGTGSLRVKGRISAPEGAFLRATLLSDGALIHTEQVPVSRFIGEGLHWEHLPVRLWWPNLEGDQFLYTFELALLARDGTCLDTTSRRVGFRHIVWAPCEGAAENADPWICVVNGRPVFLQGVNFPPILPNFAEVTTEDYRKRLTLYRDLGANILRINACGFLEKECFYDLCDKLGLMVWQEFPLTSSGLENVPPADEASIGALARIAESFIARRQHHPSLILWSGGNELADEGFIPLDSSHPMLHRLQEIVREHDPARHFLAASPSGPRFSASAKDFGKGLHWDVHGPYSAGSLASWTEYWQRDDALFRSELAAAGASPPDIIRRYLGQGVEMPVSSENPLWRYPVSWWLEAEQFATEHGRAPASLEEYVAWSQQRQARALTIAVRACKARFPRCGGVILWCGHDCFPCAMNTSIIDFHGDPKPAALALAEIWRAPAKS
jgi:beta-mannosidase